MSSVDTTRLSLLLRLRNRSDRLSWNEFHGRYGHLLYRYARRRGAGPEDAEDIVQDVEMAVFKALDGFEYDARKGRFRGYLRTAVVRAMGRRADRERRQPDTLDPQRFDTLVEAVESQADEQWEAEWRLHQLRMALHGVAHELDPGPLKAFEMHVLGGRSVAETAEALGVSKWSVYRARNRVLARLRSWLCEHGSDNDF